MCNILYLWYFDEKVVVFLALFQADWSSCFQGYSGQMNRNNFGAEWPSYKLYQNLSDLFFVAGSRVRRKFCTTVPDACFVQTGARWVDKEPLISIWLYSGNSRDFGPYNAGVLNINALYRWCTLLVYNRARERLFARLWHKYESSLKTLRGRSSITAPEARMHLAWSRGSPIGRDYTLLGKFREAQPARLLDFSVSIDPIEHCYWDFWTEITMFRRAIIHGFIKLVGSSWVVNWRNFTD